MDLFTVVNTVLLIGSLLGIFKEATAVKGGLIILKM